MPTSLRDAAFADVETELATTRRVLERVPADRFDWRPHAKSMTLGELAVHIVTLLHVQTATLEHDGFDLAERRPPSAPPETTGDLVAAFDRRADALREALAETTDEDLAQTWTLRAGRRTLSASPRGTVLRHMGLSHVAHHRGQLSVYLRMLDVPLPPMYGPTADER